MIDRRRSSWLAARAVLGAGLLLCAAALATPAEAQCRVAPGEERTTPCDDRVAPQIYFSPDGGSSPIPEFTVEVTWKDKSNTRSPVITLNDTVVSAHFTTSTTDGPVEDVENGLHGTSSGTFQLRPGNNVLSVRVCDDWNNCATKTATYTVSSTSSTPPLQGPPLSSPGRLNSYGEVVAAAYRQVHLREPNADELLYWTDFLSNHRNGSDVRYMVRTLAQSAEFTAANITGYSRSRAIARTYQRVMGREPTAAETQAASATATSAGWNQVIQNMVEGNAYLNRYGRNMVPGPGMHALYFDPRVASVTLDPVSIAPVRDACFAACGDLVLAHALQPTTVRGSAYQPSFVYNSQHARPTPTVAAWVTPSPSEAGPIRVTAVLGREVPGGGTVEVARWNWSGSNWPAGEPRRIALSFDASQLATGMHYVVLQTSITYPDGRIFNHDASGLVPVVNRSKSPYGQGWWPAGVEQLVHVNPETILRVTPSGSIHTMYASNLVANTWVDASFTRSDTLKLDTQRQVYTRTLPNGTRVEYKDGVTIGVVDPVGHRTELRYATVPNHGRALKDIITPVSNRAFEFTYNGNGELTGATSWADGQGRQTGAYSIVGGRLVNYSDPVSGRPASSFTFDGLGRVLTQTDPAGTVTTFGYDGAGKVSLASVDLQGTGPNSSVSVTSQYARGTGAPVAAADVYTAINGPRADLTDHTRVFLNGYGAPAKIVDAFNATTTVERTHPRFPALVTRSVGPDGVAVRTWYDAGLFGRVDSTRVENPLGDNRNAVTRFNYDTRWKYLPVLVVGPDSVSHRAAYDSLTGNPLWKQTGDDAARRVQFDYHASGMEAGQLHKIRSPLPSGQIATTTFGYDAIGNSKYTIDARGLYTIVDRNVWGRVVDTFTPVDSATSISEAVRTHGVRHTVLVNKAGEDSLQLTRGPALTIPWVYGTWASRTTLPSQGVAVQTLRDVLGRPVEVARWNWNTASYNVERPEPGTDGLTVTKYEYDRAGRMVRVKEGNNAADRFEYDVAGNMVESRLGGGEAITYVYDALGRVVKRTTPGVEHERACLPRVLEAETDPELPGYPSDCGSAPKFPYFPNDVSGAYRIGQDVATFWYDAAGRLYAADNRDARIRRTYLPGGLLETDSVQIRAATGNDFSAHTYGIRYRYDLAGRVTSLTHPANLAGPASRDTITYHAATGQVARITSRTGVSFDHGYDVAGRMEWRSSVVGTDYLTYDVVGQLIKRDGPAFVETSRYDARGKNVWRREGQDAAGREFYNHFDGLGALAATEWRRTPKGGLEMEEFVTNAVGQTQWRRRADDLDKGYHPVDTLTHDANSGRVRWITALAPRDHSTEDSTRWETTRLFYDSIGNTQWSRHLRQTRDPYHRVERAYYHGADKRLAAVQTLDENGLFFTGERRGSFEEHRYDAFGRRVLKRTRRDGLCRTSNPSNVDCASVVERFVWSGNDLLWELRRKDGAESTVGDEFGAVGYTHGGGTDRPLVMWKGTGTTGISVVVPHAAWRGSFGAGTDIEGPAASSRIEWPAFSSTVWHGQISSGSPDKLWFGSLVSESREASGLMFRRARFYDPQVGQFTQSDPIGVAGGLNTYGFGAGDPVSNRDPSGLAPESNDPCEGLVGRKLVCSTSETGLAVPLGSMTADGGCARTSRTCYVRRVDTWFDGLITSVNPRSNHGDGPGTGRPPVRRALRAIYQCKYDVGGLVVGAIAGGAAKKLASAADDLRWSGQYMYQSGHSVMGLKTRGLVDLGLDNLHKANALDAAAFVFEMSQLGGTMIGVWDLGNCLHDNY